MKASRATSPRSIASLFALGLVTFASRASAQGPFSGGGDEGAAEATVPPAATVVVRTASDEVDRPPQPKRPSPPVGLRVDGGYSPRELVSLPMAGADMGLAFGAQPKRSVAFWGASRLFLGSTQNGLDVFSFRIGGEVEGILLDRLRLGGGMHAFVVGVGRAVRDQTILSWGPAASATARIDLIQSDGFAIFARAAIDAGYEIYNGTIFWGPTLGGGVDFDIGGQRAALK